MEWITPNTAISPRFGKFPEQNNFAPSSNPSFSHRDIALCSDSLSSIMFRFAFKKSVPLEENSQNIRGNVIYCLLN